jgi:hypothetical protein
MGIRAEVTEQTEADLERIRCTLAGLGDDDPNRAALDEREAELSQLLVDLEGHLASPGVLAATAQVGPRGGP